MPVPVVNIRKVRVIMANRRMLMDMTVSTVACCFTVMLVLVMLVVSVPVAVLQRLMQMQMLMALGQVQPDSVDHAGCRDPEQQRH